MSQFGKGNYLTSPNAVVGVARHKNYFVNKPRANSTGASFFNERSKVNHTKGTKEEAKKRYNIMKEMLHNEKKANKLLDNEIKSLTENLT